MLRLFILMLLLFTTVTAQSKSIIYIDGGKGSNCSPGGNYDELASAIQKSSTKTESGSFWLVMAKTKEGKIAAQTIGLKGKTNGLQMVAINVAEKFKFSSDFDLLMLRIVSEVKKARRR